MMLLEEGEEKTRDVVNEEGGKVTKVVRKDMSRQKVMEEGETGGLPPTPRLRRPGKSALRVAAVLRWKV
jgi:hypothetical protein